MGIQSRLCNFSLHLILLMMLFLSSCQASNILVSPLIGKGSHFYLSAAIGERLIARGHNLTYLVSNAFEDHVKSSHYGKMFNYEVFKHPIPVEDIHGQFHNLSRSISSLGRASEYTMSLTMLEARRNDCAAILDDEILMSRLQSKNFSAVLYDITWICGAMIGVVLDIPYFAVVPYPSPCFHTASEGSGFNPAFVPSMMTSYSNIMSFKERLVNSAAFVLHRTLGIQFSVQPYNLFSEHFGLPDPYDIMKRTKLWFVNSDFVGEYPCALPPNVIPVGGLTVRDPEPLPSDIQDFIQGSGDDGIIICSFGTFLILDESNAALSQMFVDAFSRLPQRVIWLSKTSPPIPVPSSIKIVPWLPQNDILGHPQTRAIFFHGGHNTYYETIYHGVPSVLMPVFADQFGVANRVVHFGLGRKLNKDNVTSDSIYQALYEVTTNATYMRTAKRMSAIFRHRPLKPAERAAFWLDHAIKHDTKYMYLEVPVDSLTIFQYYLLDVIALFLLVITFSVYFTVKCITLLCKRICHFQNSTKKAKAD